MLIPLLAIKRRKKINMLYGRLSIIKELEPCRDKKGRQYRILECLCECGKKKEIRRNAVLTGKTKSCGCIHKEFISSLNKKHGMRCHRLYPIYNDMIQRCYNENNSQYKNYGGRGITVCSDWKKNIESFIKDMFLTYHQGLQIDRINNNKKYCKANCCWSTPKENTNNRRCTIKYLGKDAMSASRELGFNHNEIRIRIKSGWAIKKAFTTPKMR